MSHKVIQVEQETYQQFKQDVLDCKIIKRVEIQTSSLEVNSLKAISFGGTILMLQPKAQTQLMKAMGVSGALIEALKSTYDDSKVLNTILTQIRNAKKSSKVLTLIYNDKLKVISGVYPTRKKLISDQQYFDSLESLLAKTPGAFLKAISMNDAGELFSIIHNPAMEFQFGGMANEVFTCGISFDLTVNGLTSNFFTHRLICSNGMQIQDKLCTESVQVNEKVPEFLQAILSPSYYLSSIEEFKKRINRTYHTIASLEEVLTLDRKIQAVLGNFSEVLTDRMSVHRLKNDFGENYLINTSIHRYLKTDLTLWDLTNEVTAVSSRIEQNNIIVPESTNMKLQIVGGDLLFKKPHLSPSNIKQIF